MSRDGYWGMECHHCGASFTTGADGSTRPLCPYCASGWKNRCPKCGSKGRYKATADDGTIIWQCPRCVQHGIGLDDVPYAFPLHYDSSGRTYI